MSISRSRSLSKAVVNSFPKSSDTRAIRTPEAKLSSSGSSHWACFDKTDREIEVYVSCF
jgi:hypothetical protein